MTAPARECQPDTELVRDLRARRIMCDGGNGNVYDIADATCEQAADRIEELAKALAMQESADEAHANCSECDGEEVPELCPKCFPLFDDARVARRLALGTCTMPLERSGGAT